MKRLFIVLTAILLFSGAHSTAQNRMGKYGYPIYEDYTVPKPDKPLNITRDDLKLTDKYLPLYPEGIAYADAEGLRRLYNYYKDDPQGQKAWKGLQDNALKCIPTWDVSKILTTRKRYMYAFLTMKQFAELYIFTGNELVSDFIRAHLAKAAALPIDFWMHAELRKLDPKKPKGYLESSHISRMLGTVITAVRRNMSEEEIRNIETAWYERAHIPMQNWLETPNLSNFTAVISCGLLYSSKYFHDKAAWDRGVWGLKYYVDHTISKDGSDEEGYGYYAYPAGLLFEAAMIMDENEMKQVFEGGDIDKTMTWRLYGQMFDEDESGWTKRISYSDNSYGGIKRGETDIASALSMYIYTDGIAAWIRENYEMRMNKNIMLLDAKFPGLNVKAVSPVEAGLPLIRAFDSGDCFIRSNWEADGMVLGLKSGDCGARVAHAHNRPELHSLTLGAYGEYFIVTCGSASYRSPIHKKYDRSTRAANTLTIDDANQKYPGKAVVTKAEQLPDGTYFLRSDVEDMYSAPVVKGSFRSVQYVPEGGFYIVRDCIGTRDGMEHKYDYRFHIFNRDEETVISGKPDFIKVSRPKANLYIAMNSKMELTQKEGYMHGPGSRDYDPDGPNQGKLGSAVELDWSCTSRAVDICCVLFPTHKGEAAPKVKFGKNSVTVNGKTYTLVDDPLKPVDPSKQELFLSFDNAANFVTKDGKAIGARVSGQKEEALTYANAIHGDFRSKIPGYEKFIFNAATVCNWGGYLTAPVGTYVRLPKVKGYTLSSVEVTSVKNSGNKKYKITASDKGTYKEVPAVTGGEEFIINKADPATASHVWNLSGTDKGDLYLVCAQELAAKLVLTYKPVSAR